MLAAAVSRPRPGEETNGDGYLIAGWSADTGFEQLASSRRNGSAIAVDPVVVDTGRREQVLIAVVDGIGHGAEAAAVTEAAVDCIERNLGLGLRELVIECHRAILHSRGAALGLMRIDVARRGASFIGVGNVEAQVGHFATDGIEVARPVANNGVVGYHLPANLLIHTCEIRPGGLIAIYSDGIDQQFDLRHRLEQQEATPSSIAAAALRDHASPLDDATLIVARRAAGGSI